MVIKKRAHLATIFCVFIVYSTVYSRRGSKKTSSLPVTGLCAGNSPVTGEFPAQMASNAENVSIWWRHHVYIIWWRDNHLPYTWINNMECIFDVSVILIRRAFACLDKPGPKSRAARSVVMEYCVLIAHGVYPMKYVHGCDMFCFVIIISLHWHHNGRDGVSNHHPDDWLLNCLFRCRPKKTSKLHVTGLCAGNSPVTG